MTTTSAAALRPSGPELRSSAGLTVQTRMGFSDPARMRSGLLAVRDSGTRCLGTITLDSFTRTGQHDRARAALASGQPLNGYPLVAHGAERTRELLAGVAGPGFPVQVRHGSARPYRIFETMLDAGITATEGGPVSYCLPYSRVPLDQAAEEWARACELLAGHPEPVHLETFGGCMLGQLCPPDLLVALSVLEAMFFAEHGLRSVSLSHAQQTHPGQDAEALYTLRELADEYLPPEVSRHVVVYTYMGVYPQTPGGAVRLLEDSARLAAATGSERLIVKTVAEAVRIPTVAENVQALRHAEAAARTPGTVLPDSSATPANARRLIEAVLALAPTVRRCLVLAFRRGLLDVPYCLHPDNANLARAAVTPSGRLVWRSTGRMPIRPDATEAGGGRVRAAELLEMLAHVQHRYDRPATTAGTVPDPALDPALDPAAANPPAEKEGSPHHAHI